MNTLITAFACTLLLALLGAMPCSAAEPAAASAVNPAAPVVLTPAQANSALRVLSDPVQRAHVEDTLRAIAAAGALAAPASAASATATTGA
ncbi:MAG TPA: mechanosensitive ion channel protein, partial [Paraburkholderia sp.]|nr:mechanosensitive ion channel protein [Paraburkholderia sp.]